MHKVFKTKKGELRYLCNWACIVLTKKATFTNKLVTCKNCLNILKKKQFKDRL